MVIFSSVDQRLQNNCFLATWSHHGRARALLQPLRVLHVPLYNHGLRFSVGGRSDLRRKGDFLNLETCLANLVLKHSVLANIVIIAFVSVGGLRSPALPHQGQSGLEKWCADHRMGWHHCIDPPYVLVSTPDHRMGGHIYEDLMGLDDARRQWGRQQHQAEC